MGLDMYLTATKYIKDWEHMYEGGVIPDDTPAKRCAAAAGVDLPARAVEFDLGYWRKANAIHKWFVDNCQSGVDDCRRAYVEPDQLLELRDLCGEVLANPEKAAELLPTQSGFFFGGTAYDEWYMGDLHDTVDIINNALEKCSGMGLYYQSSW